MDDNLEISADDNDVMVPGGILTVADSKVLLQLIDRSASAGLLKGPELLPVGAVRYKLEAAMSAASSKGDLV